MTRTEKVETSTLTYVKFMLFLILVLSVLNLAFYLKEHLPKCTMEERHELMKDFSGYKSYPRNAVIASDGGYKVMTFFNEKTVYGCLTLTEDNHCSGKGHTYIAEWKERVCTK